MATDGVPAGLDKEQVFGMAEKEMEYRVDLFNRLTQTCFNKCIEKKYKESELNMGENSCIDRCVSKYWQVTNLVGGLLGQNNEILLPRIADRDVNAIGRAGMGGRGGSGTSSGGRTGAGTYDGASKNGGTRSSASTSSYSSGMGMAAFATAGGGNKRNGASSRNDCKVVGFGLSATKIAVVTPFVLLLGNLWL